MKYTAAELEQTFQGALRAVAECLEAAQAPWMLIGGLAVGVWTEPRGTKDVDIALSVVDAAELGESLQLLGFDGAAEQLAAVATGGVARLKSTIQGPVPIVVDLLCAGTEFEADALLHRRRAQLFGLSLWVAAPDDLLVYKLIAGRPQDLADIDRLIRIAGAPQDIDRVRRWAVEWDIEDRLDMVLQTASR